MRGAINAGKMTVVLICLESSNNRALYKSVTAHLAVKLFSCTPITALDNHILLDMLLGQFGFLKDRNTTMYKILSLLPLLMLLGCAMTQEEATDEQALASGNGLPHLSSINHLAQQMVNELVRQNDSLKPTQPLLVATPVMLSDLVTTNELGLQYQQGLIAALHDHQFNLIDMNVAETLRVTQEGDFILTRDWQQLPANIDVRHVVVSTMSPSKEGVVVYSRIVDVSNNRVISVAQSFVPITAMPDMLTPSERVVSENGLLYRSEHAGQKAVNLGGAK